MHSLKSIKHIFLFFLTFFLGVQIHYAKSELILPTKSISLSIEKTHIFGSLAKEAFLESLDENWQPIGELVTPEGYRFAMHDDRSISERVLSIVKDAQGKYRAGVKKLAEGVDDLLETTLSVLKKEFPNKWRYNKIGNDAYEIIDANGQKWGTLYSDRIVANGRTLKGAKGNPILNKVPLLKNMRYEVDGFVYLTDDLGRVVKTNADLDDIARIRLGNQQIRAVDVKDGVRGTDQGGHIIGSRFFGPGEQINLYPQSATLNQGAWKQMENLWAKEMVAGKDVKVEIRAIFEGNSKRPSKFKVQFTIDGQPFSRSYSN